MMQEAFTSSRIAKAMIEKYGKKTDTIKVDMQNRNQIEKFVRTFEQAHEETAKSKLVFKGYDNAL